MATIIKVILNGVEYPGALRQRRKLKVTSTFDNDSVQANITFSTLNFVGEAKKAIDDWMDPEGNNKATEATRETRSGLGIPLDDPPFP